MKSGPRPVFGLEFLSIWRKTDIEYAMIDATITHTTLKLIKARPRARRRATWSQL